MILERFNRLPFPVRVGLWGAALAWAFYLLLT